METFFPIGILLILALIVCGGILLLTNLLGPRFRFPNPKKLNPYECGVSVPEQSTARQPLEIKFYLIAVLFLLFDVEGAFFLPWALVYRESLQVDGTLLYAMLAYLFFLVLGLIYIYRKGFVAAK